MRFNLVSVGLLLALFVVLNVSVQAQDSGQRTARAEATIKIKEVEKKYNNLPGGVTLEGSAEQLQGIKQVSYDKTSNSLLLDGQLRYPLSIERKEARDLALALAQDDRLGVSLGERTDIVYGKLDKNASIVRELKKADKYLADVVFARESVKFRKLPGNYKPQAPAELQVRTGVYFNFTDYVFESQSNTLVSTARAIEIIIIPLKDEKTGSGGHIADYEALENGNVPEEFQTNADHIANHQAAYALIKEVKPAVVYGETAAVLRSLRDCGIDLTKLARELD